MSGIAIPVPQPVSLAAVGSSPNANGASLSGQVLTLQLADASNPGLMGIGAQTFAGPKTFNGLVTSGVASGSNAFLLATGARFKLGGGTTDYLVSDGSTGLSTPANFTALSLSANGFSVISGNLSCGQITNGGLIVSASSAVQEITGQVADGASNIAVAIGPFAGAPWTLGKICVWRNQRAGTEKLALRANGKFVWPTGQADSVAGVATLVGGTVTVNTTAVKTASAVLYARKTTGGTVGQLSVTIVDSTSFTITSSSGTETSTISWLIIND